MTALSVNLNKVATLRNTRHHDAPSVMKAARIVLEAGAAGVTVHPRPDARHIRERDVFDLAELLRAPEWAGREFNVEGYPDDRFLELIERVRPDQVTLVPDAPEQSTSDHGWDLPADAAVLTPIVARVQKLGCRVSLFADPDVSVIEGAKAVGADRVELYTGTYHDAFGGPQQDEVLAVFVVAAQRARDLGLGLNAGHDLTLDNLPTLSRAIPWIDEVSIGHHLIGDALWMGIAASVKAYQKCLEAGQSQSAPLKAATR
ncbi:pyridoxine 5'-phosphate synthase [Thalassobaculum sp.]|uniref:pyridoxine 5'-phosphate synthase n=1 Tax=Thalassobaculum sp. TaxID=2022740 RepID=UPI0032ED7240